VAHLETMVLKAILNLLMATVAVTMTKEKLNPIATVTRIPKNEVLLLRLLMISS
jgi:hypothetical protein